MTSIIEYNSKYKRVLHRIIRENIGEDTSYILDIGCGEGDDLEKISINGMSVFGCGIDISLDSLISTSRKLEKANNFYLLRTDVRSLPFKKDSFDIVICSEVIEHVETEEAEELAKDVRRILKPQGIFIVTTPSRYNYSALIGEMIPPGTFKNFLRKGIYYINPGSVDVNPHAREYTPNEIKKLLQNHGFTVERITAGVLRVPFWVLFERVPFLLLIWGYLDRLLDRLSFGIHLKFNFVVLARKRS